MALQFPLKKRGSQKFFKRNFMICQKREERTEKKDFKRASIYFLAKEYGVTPMRIQQILEKFWDKYLKQKNDKN